MRRLLEKFGTIMDDTQDVFDRMLTGEREFKRPDGTKLVIGRRASQGLMLLGGVMILFGGMADVTPYSDTENDFEEDDGEETED